MRYDHSRVRRSFANRASQAVDVLLISMPFGPLNQPSIGLSLLKATLAPLDLSVKVLYLTLPFAEQIGAALYGDLANGKPLTHDLTGEWIFSGALFDPAQLDVDGYLNGVLRRGLPVNREVYITPEEFIQDVLDVRDKVDHFLDQCLAEVLAYRPQIVGFTSVFQQQVASLALAKRIKMHAPDTRIIFGGANCEGMMGVEVVRQFSFVDAVVSGEGDLIFPDLISRLLEHKPLDGLQGVYTRDILPLIPTNGAIANAPTVRDMDALPFPDYDDFFEQIAPDQLDQRHPIRLLFETSRGCWWGEKNHCTFCGLNGSTMSYRSKSARRAMDELVFLIDRYPGCPVSVVDNILDMQYFKDFVPELAAKRLNLELFYEVKANLRKEQVRLLRDAGITAIQPGIESLSDTVLTLMRKGVRSIQNIQLLKWCQELGVRPFWNVLWGFPGEPPEEYTRTAELIPYLSHLNPPVSFATIRLDRFSPNFDRAEQLGFTDVRPYPAYTFIYPLMPEAVANLAYHFTFQYREPQQVMSYTQPVVQQIAAWKRDHETSGLFWVDKETCLLIWDLRPAACRPLTVLHGVQRVLYIACDQARTLRQLGQMYEESTGAPASTETIAALLQPLVDQRLMVREGGLYLSLAIPLGDYSPSRPILERLQALLKTLGSRSDNQIVIQLTEATASANVASECYM